MFLNLIAVAQFLGIIFRNTIFVGCQLRKGDDELDIQNGYIYIYLIHL